MNSLLSFFTIVLLLILVLFQIIIVLKLNQIKNKNIYIISLILSLLVAFGLVFLIAWWGYFSDKILLSNYGYDFEAMNDIERYLNVSKENFEKVKELERSMGGIGWPLKAILFYFVFYLPYFLIVHLFNYFIKKNNQGKVNVTLFSNKFLVL